MRLNVSLTRAVARFDIVNDATKSHFSIEKEKLEELNRQIHETFENPLEYIDRYSLYL